MTTQSVGRMLGVSPRRVLALAQSRGVQPAVVVGRSKLWRPETVEALRPRPTGRPKLLIGGI